MYDFQKASMWKRISAFLFDFILICIVIVGFALLLSAILGFNGYSERFEAIQESYEKEYSTDLEQAYDLLSDEERVKYDEAYNAFSKDEEANYLYSMITNLILIITIFSILLGFVLMEFVIPLILKNGQTLGKKIFGIAVMRQDGVRLSPLLLFVRTILGKFTVETMVLLFISVLVVFNLMGIIGIAIIAAILIAQVVLLIVTKARTPLHDVLAHTVTVDFASQMIFDSTEDMIAYKKRIHAEQVASEKN